MANNKTVITYTIGEKVYNTQFDGFSRTAEVVEKDGKLKARFYLEETKKFHLSDLSELWQKLPESAPADVLGDILTNAENKPEPEPITPEPIKDEPKTEAKPEFVPMSAAELERKKKLVAEYKNKDIVRENAYLRQCEIIHEIRTEQLFRDNYRSFAEFAAAELNVTREYSQNLAQIGEFYSVSKDFIKENKLSVNAINQLIRNQNKLSASLGMSENDLSEFAPVLDQVLQATIEASKNEKGKVSITPKIVSAVAEQIAAEVGTMKTEKTGAELIAAAAELLGSKKADILTRTRESLTDTGKDKKKPSDGTETGKDKAIETSLECELEHSTLTIEMLDTLANTLKFECGCLFNLVKANKK